MPLLRDEAVTACPSISPALLTGTAEEGAADRVLLETKRREDEAEEEPAVWHKKSRGRTDCPAAEVAAEGVGVRNYAAATGEAG